jgi:hypothetical protein
MSCDSRAAIKGIFWTVSWFAGVDGKWAHMFSSCIFFLVITSASRTVSWMEIFSSVWSTHFQNAFFATWIPWSQFACLSGWHSYDGFAWFPPSPQATPLKYCHLQFICHSYMTINSGHYPSCIIFKTGRFGDRILSLSSGRTYSVGPNR